MIKIFNRFIQKKTINDNQFHALGLSNEIVRALSEKGYQTPTPIQEAAIPEILLGHDVLAAAQTGTGKTAGFTLPMLQKLSRTNVVDKRHGIRALILTPTRELAAQILESILTYGEYVDLCAMAVFGGVNINPQKQRLKQGVDILIATPGRLLDLVQQKSLDLRTIEFFVLDEADRMLDMGFIHDIKKIASLLPKKRQTLLFSATFSPEIRGLAQRFLVSPKEISVTPKNTTAKTVHQTIYAIEKRQKSAALLHLIRTQNPYQVLVFHRTKHGANKLTNFLLKHGINASAIHGNKTQSARMKALSEFKSGNVQVLVATDIASRGLDISELPQVVNFELPDVPEDYVHRIGRTGRAGAFGQAISLVSSEESKQLRDIERLTKKTFIKESLTGFDFVSQETSDRKPFKLYRKRSPNRSKRQGSDLQSSYRKPNNQKNNLIK